LPIDKNGFATGKRGFFASHLNGAKKFEYKV
jgi:hypothetical protein